MFGQRVGIAAGLALAGAVVFLTPGESGAWGRGYVGFHGGYGGYTHITPFGNVSYYGHGGPYYGYRPYYGYGYGYGGLYGGYGYGGYSMPVYNNYYYPPAYTVQQAAPVVTYTAGYAPAPVNTARIDIQLPPTAELYVEGQKMKQTGPRRTFVSPALEPGQKYTYTIKATWTANGEPVTVTKDVPVQAGDRQSLTLLSGDKPTPTPPAPAANN